MCLVFLLEITQHDILATGENLARHIHGIFGVNLDLHTRSSLAARTRASHLPVGIADDGSAFGHAVTHGEWELDTTQELLDVAAQGCTTCDNLVEVAAQCLDEFLAKLVVDHTAQQWQGTHGLDGELFKLREYALAHNLFEDEWNKDNEFGTQLLERSEDVVGIERLGEEVDICSA